ncbi:hypothetical protein VL10_ORF10 [Staphylococcus phage vB_SauM_VL10]|nr:hypothetical protein VL10_ORF10 [Staphylococcus phage vB_SauM_VL10]
MNKKFIDKEVNSDTGEVRYKDPSWSPYFDGQEYLKEQFMYGKMERKEFEEKFFNFITEFQSNLRENYNIGFADLGRLLLLITYTSYRDKELGRHYLLTDNNKRMSNKELSKVWKLNTNQARNVKNMLKRKGVIGEDDEGLYITDDIMIRGKVFPKEKRTINYYVVYDKPIRYLYNSLTEYEVRNSSSSVGVFMSLIPYIKVSTSKKKTGEKGSNNSLVLSEWDNKYGGYKPLNKTSLAKVLGVDYRTLDKHLGELNTKSKELTGRYLLYDVKPTGYNELDYTIMVVNPYYTYTQGINSKSFELLEGWINEADKRN